MTEQPDDLSEPRPMKRLSEDWWASRPPEVRARRCHAHRRNGNQCGKVAMAGQQVCGTHGGRAPQAINKARRRLDEASDRLVMRLLGFAESDKVPAYVSLDAVKDALNRIGVVTPQTVNLSVTAPWEEVMGAVTGIAQISRAESRAARGMPPPAAIAPPGDGDIVYAEVVPDPPSGPSASRTGGDRADVPAQPGTGLQTLDDALEDLRRMQRRR